MEAPTSSAETTITPTTTMTSNTAATSCFCVEDECCQAIEQLLVREPGYHKIKGGVQALYNAAGKGQLLQLAQALLQQQVQVVALLVGSANCTIMWPPTDTDGPAGAAALVKTLKQLGKQVIVVSDEINHEQVVDPFKKVDISMVELEDLSQKQDVNQMPIVYMKVSCQRNWSEDDDRKLQQLYDAVDCIINVGRPGPAEDGQTRAHDKANMTGFDATFKYLYVCPDKFILRPEHKVVTAVIAELGNELGMGKHVEFVKEQVENGKEIACTVPCDYTLISTTATWGAWGLCAMLGLLATRTRACSCPLSMLLPDLQQQKLMLKALVEEGARCGLTWTREEQIDRFSAEENWKFLTDLCSTALSMAHPDTAASTIATPLTATAANTPTSTTIKMQMKDVPTSSSEAVLTTTSQTRRDVKQLLLAGVEFAGWTVVDTKYRMELDKRVPSQVCTRLNVVHHCVQTLR